MSISTDARHDAGQQGSQLPDLLVTISGGDKPPRTVKIPDPRQYFCDMWNAERGRTRRAVPTERERPKQQEAESRVHIPDHLRQMVALVTAMPDGSLHVEHIADGMSRSDFDPWHRDAIDEHPDFEHYVIPIIWELDARELLRRAIRLADVGSFDAESDVCTTCDDPRVPGLYCPQCGAMRMEVSQ